MAVATESDNSTSGKSDGCIRGATTPIVIKVLAMVVTKSHVGPIFKNRSTNAVNYHT